LLKFNKKIFRFLAGFLACSGALMRIRGPPPQALGEHDSPSQMRHGAKRIWREIIAAWRGVLHIVAINPAACAETSTPCLKLGDAAHEKIKAASPLWGEAASTIA
jgi:hypothetical protein